LKSWEYEIVAFCDGACKGNPGPGGWGAFVASVKLGRVRELGGGRKPTTNNEMELTAAIEALRHCAELESDEKILLCTDSSYVIQGATAWIWGWRKKGWKKADGGDVLHRPLWESIGALCERLRGRLEWRHLPSHVGIPGNERVDEIGASFAEGRPVKLYDGSIVGCGFDPFEKIDEETARTLAAQKKAGSAPKKGKSTAPAAPGYPIYLSLVNGKLARDPAWGSCEGRVKGVPGAKFKKVMNPEEEQVTLTAWGYNS
jgi:ribonuclease HI